MFNIGDMFGKLREMQAEMEKAKARLDEMVIEGQSGAGMVKAQVNGNRRLLKVEIEPAIFAQGDREMIEDLVAAAVNRAMELAEQKAKEELQKASSGVMPNIPGMDLGSLGL